MPSTAQINIKLDFEQVLNIVKQLPKKQQKQLAGLIENEKEGKAAEKQTAFLNELDEAVDFVNNYKKGETPVTSFKQMLDAL